MKINGTYFALFPLHNGMPQGSPLSVMLFKIAFNELSLMINKYQYIDHCIHADDLYIFAKKNCNIITNEILQTSLNSFIKKAKNQEPKYQRRKQQVPYLQKIVLRCQTLQH